jgi:hypothetical protein
MNHFVTVFDGLFLPQFVALARSFERRASGYTLWALCVDSTAADAVTTLRLPNVAVIPWVELEDATYRSIKAARGPGEYCWTITPRAVREVMARVPSGSVVTYVDADVWLLGDPSSILDEFTRSGAATMVMSHGFSPQYDKGNENGRYVVQFLPFLTPQGLPIVEDWEARCLSSCSTDTSDGHFGDQTYLDDWPSTFGSLVAESRHPGRVLAPWSMDRFPVSEAVAFHFHGLRLLGQGRVWLGDHRVSRRLADRVYRPYLDDLGAAVSMLAAAGFEERAQTQRPGMSERLRRWARRRVDDLPVTRVHRLP